MSTHDDARLEQQSTRPVEPFALLTGSVVLTDDPEARAMARLLGGEIRRAPDELRTVAEHFRGRGELKRVATPLAARGLALVLLDRPDVAMRDIRLAVELARTLGQDEVEAFALWQKSEAETALGRHDDAMSSADEVLAVAERVDHDGWVAPAWRAVGLAQAGAGAVMAARLAQQRSLDAGVDLPLFACWARSRLALLAIELDDSDAAADLVRLALSEGPPLAQYEARLASATLAAHRHDAVAARLVADARRRAVDGGHLASARALASV